MAYFGKIPTQIFQKPHPKRIEIQKPPFQEYPKITTAEPFKTFNASQNYESQLIKHLNGCFSTSSQIPIVFNFSKVTNKYIIMKRNGQGIKFSI